MSCGLFGKSWAVFRFSMLLCSLAVAVYLKNQFPLENPADPMLVVAYVCQWIVIAYLFVNMLRRRDRGRDLRRRE